MDYIVEGGNSLKGEIAVYGAKNCVLTLLGATVLTDEQVVLTNCPPIQDVKNMIAILQYMGKNVTFQNNCVVVTGSVTKTSVPSSLGKLLRGSVLVLGSTLAKCGCASLPLPGGCAIGLRPIDIHIDGLRKMGVDITEDNCYVVCQNKPKATKYTLRYASVGATENLICASVLSEGTTILHNCAIEPEIVCLQKMLVKMGANIRGIGRKTVVIKGVNKLGGVDMQIIPDRIVTATYLSAVACAGGNVTITNCNPKHLTEFLKLFKQFEIKTYDDVIKLNVSKKAKGYGFVKTAPYPKFATDMQSLLLSMACCTNGTQTIIEERLFENRLEHNALQLKKMGANIRVDGNHATVVGGKLSGATVIAGDLRGGAGLVVAGLGAFGNTTVKDVYHIDRGYLNLAQSLNNIGAKISY